MQKDESVFCFCGIKLFEYCEGDWWIILEAVRELDPVDGLVLQVSL
jgi:hypothetical protein